tara:strand:- start:160 stop:846 length:687 start_codon:yes stop_codon:yes gene_type:complete
MKKEEHSVPLFLFLNMKKYIYIILISFYSCTSSFTLNEGDLLFQDLDSSPLCEAIEMVTPGYQEADLSHVGLIVSDKGELKVLEAIPPKVKLTKINDFLSRSADINNNPKVIVGRLKPNFTSAIKDAIIFSKSKLNMKYDDSFVLNNSMYYCSELIHEAFIKDSIFKLLPMTFLHPKTKDTLDIWKEYYKELNIKIPQGDLGLNPGIMSLSKKIDIVHIYGYPKGMKK